MIKKFRYCEIRYNETLIRYNETLQGSSLATGEALDAGVLHLRLLFSAGEIVRQFANNKRVHYDTPSCVHCSLSKLSKHSSKKNKLSDNLRAFFARIGRLFIFDFF